MNIIVINIASTKMDRSAMLHRIGAHNETTWCECRTAREKLQGVIQWKW